MQEDSLAKLFDPLKNLSQEILKAFLTKNLAMLDSIQIIDFIIYICDKAAAKQEKFEQLLLTFIREDRLVEQLDYDRLVEIYELAANREGGDYIQGFFLRRGVERRQILPIDIAEETPRLVKSLESYTLGERREFAKGSDVKRLEMLLYDSDYLVIRHLLNNAKILESQVLKLAAKRPQAAEALSEIFQHRRFGNRYEVRKALTFNPHTPRHLAFGLVNFLTRRDLNTLLQLQQGLPTALIGRASTLISRS